MANNEALRQALANAQTAIQGAISALDAAPGELPPVGVPPGTPVDPKGRPWPPLRRSDFLTDYDYRQEVAARAKAAGPDADGFPKIIEVGGVHILAKAPIDPRWKPSMTAYIFGHQAGTNVFDVANGDEAIPYQPLRSPAGFPLVYSLTPDNQVVGTATILHGDSAFSSDAEVLQMLGAEPPPARPHTMAETYPNRAALVADAELDAFAVKLDGVPIQTAQSKFGPAQSYVTNPDGSISKGRYTAPAPVPVPVIPPGAFPDVAALRAAYPRNAIILDGVGIQDGFGGDNGQPLKFATTAGYIVPVPA